MSQRDFSQKEFRLRDNPLSYAGCYSLDLYCKYENPDHNWDEFPHKFVDELGTACRKRAKAHGWKIHADNTATCPKCNKRLKNK